MPVFQIDRRIAVVCVEERDVFERNRHQLITIRDKYSLLTPLGRRKFCESGEVSGYVGTVEPAVFLYCPLHFRRFDGILTSK